MIYTEWLKEARRAALHYWCYEDLVDECEDELMSRYKAGEDPYEAIKEIGKRLDLHEFGPAWGGY